MRPEQSPSNERLIRIKEVLELTGVSRSSWWAGVKKGKFPASVKMGERTTCWKFSEILALIEKGV